MDDTLIKMQEIISDQGEDIAKLSQELYVQQRLIQNLRQELKELQDKFVAAQEKDEDIALPEPPPPHY